MNAKTRAQLIEVNRAFYEGTADAFSDSRRDPWPGWARAMSHVRGQRDEPLSVLDVGSGNGRFAGYLASEALIERAGSLQYLGIDSSASLLGHARDAHPNRERVEFLEHDLLDLKDLFSDGARRFDLIVAFGVLHHIPGEQTRRDFVQTLVSLLNDCGLLVVTAWQFGSAERFRSHTIAWSQFNEDSPDPIDEGDLEEGDYLLRFGASPFPRYCHFASKDELRGLFAGCPIEWRDEYCADGKTDNLNQYAVVSRHNDATN